jgi:uncharacterized protein
MVNIAVLAIVSGTLIGSVGIGGVLLVPCLTFAGVDVHVALAGAMFSFLFSGLVGVWLYWRGGSIDWTSAAWLGSGATPGAFAGAVLASRLDGRALLALIGIVVMATGIRSLHHREKGKEGQRLLSPLPLFLVGGGVGAASAMIGTGGPLLLVPLLMSLRMPVRAAVGLAQAIQIPIAGLATLGNLIEVHFDPSLGIVLGLGVAAGTAVGARLAHAASLLFLTRFVAVVLLLVGALVLARSWQSFAGPFT